MVNLVTQADAFLTKEQKVQKNIFSEMPLRGEERLKFYHFRPLAAVGRES